MSEELRKRIAELEAETNRQEGQIESLQCDNATKDGQIKKLEAQLAEAVEDIDYVYCPKCKKSVPKIEVSKGFHTCGRYTVAMFSEERRMRYRAEERIAQLEAKSADDLKQYMDVVARNDMLQAQLTSYENFVESEIDTMGAWCEVLDEPEQEGVEMFVRRALSQLANLSQPKQNHEPKEFCEWIGDIEVKSSCGRDFTRFSRDGKCFNCGLEIKEVCEHEYVKAAPNPYGIAQHCKKCNSTK